MHILHPKDRRGMWEIKWRLEDLTFQYTNAIGHAQISDLLTAKRGERKTYLQEVMGILRDELKQAGIKAELSERTKNIYSIYKKISKYAEHNRSPNEIYDLFALRILLDEVSDCYAALGIVHAKWRPLTAHFDDYIVNPKDNLYRSLHTIVLCLNGGPVEIQIRTHEMHGVSEYVVAAHWVYKESGASEIHFEEKMTWLRQLLEWQRDVRSPEEFVDSFKTDIFDDQVFAYTPKG